MSIHDHSDERPIDYDLPETEGVEPADVSERLDVDPDAERNLTDTSAPDPSDDT